jgi:hypothetical protein
MISYRSAERASWLILTALGMDPRLEPWCAGVVLPNGTVEAEIVPTFASGRGRNPIYKVRAPVTDQYFTEREAREVGLIYLTARVAALIGAGEWPPKEDDQ